MKPAPTTIVYASLLIILGLAGYISSGFASWTALIPTILGVPILVLGLLSRDRRRRKYTIAGAAVLALFGLLGTVGGLYDLGTVLSGGYVARPAAVIGRSIMAVLSIVYLGILLGTRFSSRRPSLLDPDEDDE
jgi:hypothetical protein